MVQDGPVVKAVGGVLALDRPLVLARLDSGSGLRRWGLGFGVEALRVEG